VCTDLKSVLNVANEGQLTPAEREELSVWVVLNDFLAIM
jgi:hypothetical protein